MSEKEGKTKRMTAIRRIMTIEYRLPCGHSEGDLSCSTELVGRSPEKLEKAVRQHGWTYRDGKFYCERHGG